MYSIFVFIVLFQVVAGSDIHLSCLKTKNPPRAEKLLSACQRFSPLSCCKQSDAKKIASRKQMIGNFTWHPCGEKLLSRQCAKYFRRLECFYRCSPFISQWKHPMRLAGVQRVPICGAFCDSFYQACKDELTCVKDWLNGFVIEKGWKNKCPKDSTCRKFSMVYRNGEDLCSTMWGDSLQYMKSDNPKDCFDVDFEGANPNWMVNKKDGEVYTHKRNSYLEKFFGFLGLE